MSLNCFDRQQIQHEIDWLVKKLAEVRIKAHRKTSAVQEMRDIERQIKEREVSLAFDDRAGRK
jgi:hypothetical protein